MNILTNKTISAGLIYEAKNPSGDSHSNMNGYNFRLWVEQCLFPAFEDKYDQETRMILVSDNAPYRREQGEHYINVRNDVKDRCY